MRLVLEQQTWTEIERDAATSAPQPHIVLHPSIPRDEGVTTRRKAFLEWDVPAGATVAVISEHAGASLVEWPISIVEANVTRAAEVIEARLTVFYTVLEYWTAVMWRGPRARLDAERPAILAALASGRPDWRRREIIALWQLYE